MVHGECIMATDHNKSARLADDLIWGVKGPKGIAAEIGTTERHARYLIDKGIIPTGKAGHKTIFAFRSELRAALLARRVKPHEKAER
jgi:hypothetical protein